MKNCQKVGLSVIFTQCAIVRDELQSFGRGVAMWKGVNCLDLISLSKSYSTFVPIFKNMGLPSAFLSEQFSAAVLKRESAGVNHSAKRGLILCSLLGLAHL